MMTWGRLSLVSAVASAGYLFGIKRLTGQESQNHVVAGSHLSVAVLLPFDKAQVGREIIPGPLLLPAIAGTTVSNATAILIELRTVRQTDVSKAVSILSFTPP